jgi:hypothetical protein
MVAFIAWTLTSMSNALRTYGLGAAVAVALVTGTVGWWICFHVVESAARRIAVRWFGPSGSSADRPFSASEQTWRFFHPWGRIVRMIQFAFMVVGGVVQMLIIVLGGR